MNLAAIVESFSKSRSVGHAGASSGLLLSYSERTQTATAAAVSR
jgi:hypothetical protein